jgi:hypothetical protein
MIWSLTTTNIVEESFFYLIFGEFASRSPKLRTCKWFGRSEGEVIKNHYCILPSFVIVISYQVLVLVALFDR